MFFIGFYKTYKKFSYICLQNDNIDCLLWKKLIT